jgi:hypothetical protein
MAWRLDLGAGHPRCGSGRHQDNSGDNSLTVGMELGLRSELSSSASIGWMPAGDEQDQQVFDVVLNNKFICSMGPKENILYTT